MRARIAEWLALGASLAFYAAFIARSGFSFGGRTYFVLIDDSMISMRYARNLVEGHGLVWNAGERVEGYSNFLWTLWMGATHALPVPGSAASLPVMVSGAAILLATVVAAGRLCRALLPNRPLVEAAAMALVGLCYPLVFWTLRGMETGLAALLVTLAVLLAIRLREEATTRRLVALAIVASAAVLTRDDLIVPMVVVLAFAVGWADPSRRRRVLGVMGGALALTLIAHTAFRLAYYDDALPNTYHLKLGGISLGTRLHRGGIGLAYSALTSLYLPIALAIAGLWASRRSARFTPLALLGAVVLAAFLYSLYVGGDFAEDLALPNRFIVTVAPLLMVLAAVGAARLSDGDSGARRAALLGIAVCLGAAVAQGRGWSAADVLQIPDRDLGAARVAVALLAAGVLAAAVALRTGAMFALLAALALAGVNYGPVRDWFESGEQDRAVAQAFTKEGVVLRRHTRPEATVAVVLAGDTAYFARRPSIDLLGRVDPAIAKGPRHPGTFQPGHVKWNYGHSIGRLRPDVVASLWRATPADVCQMARWGYGQIAPDFWVRNGAAGVDSPGLAAALGTVRFGPFRPIPPGCEPS